MLNLLPRKQKKQAAHTAVAYDIGGAVFGVSLLLGVRRSRTGCPTLYEHGSPGAAIYYNADIGSRR